MKATEQYFPVVLFIMLYKVVLTFDSVKDTPNCNHSNRSSCVVLSFGATCNFIYSYSYDLYFFLVNFAK